MAAKPGNQNAKGNDGGRPSEYKEEYVQEVYDYIEECVKKSKDEENFEMPTRAGLAVRLGRGRPTINRWAKKHDEFRYALEFLDSNQCKELVNGGLTGKLSSTITKLMLSSNHGMKERKDVTSKEEKVSTELTEEQRQELLEEIKDEQ